MAVLMVAAFAHLSQEQAMEAMVSSYVQDLAESMAYQLSTEVKLWNFPMEESFSGTARYRIFSWGPSIPGWLAYINKEGKVIMSSPGATNISTIWQQNLPVGTAVRVKDKDGYQHTLAIYPVDGRGYVVAAVSWDQLLGPLVRVGRLWPFLIVLMSFASFWAIRLLWRRLIFPLKGLAAEIDDLRMGKDMPNTVDPQAVKEIESVHAALTRFATAAIDRDSLRNRYVRDIVQVQEMERLDMAREIHDGPLQDITALLQQIHISLEEEGEGSKERIKKTERLAKAVVRELRGLCDELAPPWVDLGLSHALTELAERLSQNYDIHVGVEIGGEFDLDSERTLSLIRIFQEAVSNAVRHGDATEVYGRMLERDGQTLFEIKDNGKGFESNIHHESLRVEGHRGLANMTERMSLMGGTLEVKSAPGHGTSILCVLGRKSMTWEGMF